MAQVDPVTLRKARDGAVLAGFLPYLRDIAAEMENAIDNRVKTAMTAGKFNDDMAKSAWFEKMALQRIVSRVEQRVKIGTSLGESIADAMKLEETTENG